MGSDCVPLPPTCSWYRLVVSKLSYCLTFPHWQSYRAGKKRSNKKGTTSATSPLSGEGNDSAEPLPKSLAQLGRHSSISVTDVFSHGSPSDIPLTEVPTRSDLP